jgi:hypothetical protein
MNEFKKIAYENQANTIIKKLQLRHMAGYYVDNMEEATKKVLELLGSDKKTVAYGGSMTIDDSDLKERIAAAGHELIIRENAKTEEELKEVKHSLDVLIILNVIMQLGIMKKITNLQ